MITEIIAGVLAGTGWLLGIFLYRWTRDEISGFAKKLSLTFPIAVILSLALGIALAYNLTETSATLVFAGSLFFSSIYTRKPKHQIMFFLIHCAAFLIAFYTAQLL